MEREELAELLFDVPIQDLSAPQNDKLNALLASVRFAEEQAYLRAIEDVREKVEISHEREGEKAGSELIGWYNMGIRTTLRTLDQLKAKIEKS